jgi:hypothetical protein
MGGCMVMQWVVGALLLRTHQSLARNPSTNTYATAPRPPVSLRRWEWWSLWFEFCLLLSLFVVCFLESAFKRGQLTLLAFFLLATM